MITGYESEFEEMKALLLANGWFPKGPKIEVKMPKPKRIFLHDLRKHDLAKDDEIARQLEMAVDYCLTSPGYALQFWRDVQTYGVDEAILYVRNGNHGDADAITTAWNEMKERLT